MLFLTTAISPNIFKRPCLDSHLYLPSNRSHTPLLFIKLEFLVKVGNPKEISSTMDPIPTSMVAHMVQRPTPVEEWKKDAFEGIHLLLSLIFWLSISVTKVGKLLTYQLLEKLIYYNKYLHDLSHDTYDFNGFDNW